MSNCCFCSAKVEGRYRYCEDCRDTRAPWRVHHDNLDAACKYFDLSTSVVVRRTATRQLLGRYHGIQIPEDAPQDPEIVLQMSEQDLLAITTRMFHLITASARMTAEAASRTIWHELTHAAQYERDPEFYSRQYAKELAIVKRLVANGIPHARAYRMISFEIQAKANEDLHYTVYPLAIANKRVNMPMLKHPHMRISHVVDGKITAGPHAEAIERDTRQSIRMAQTLLIKSAQQDLCQSHK